MLFAGDSTPAPSAGHPPVRAERKRPLSGPRHPGQADHRHGRRARRPRERPRAGAGQRAFLCRQRGHRRARLHAAASVWHGRPRSWRARLGRKVASIGIRWDEVELTRAPSRASARLWRQIAELIPADLADILSDLSRPTAPSSSTPSTSRPWPTPWSGGTRLQASLVEALPDEKVADVLEERRRTRRLTSSPSCETIGAKNCST